VIARRSEVFPEPEGPAMPVNCPGAMLRSNQADPRVLGVARRARQVVVAQHVDVVHAGLPADLLQHRAGEDLGPEDRRDALLLDLLDQAHHLARCGLLEVLDLDRADHGPVVVPGEVGVGVVVGQQLAVGGRDGRERGPHGPVELVDHRGEPLVVVGVVVSVVGIPFREVVSNDLRIRHRVARVGPEVRVRLAARAGEREVVGILALGDRLRAELHHLGAVREVGLRELLGRLLQLQPVDVDHVDGGKQLRHARLRLEGVGVGPLGDDPGDVDAVAADARGDARDRRDGGRDPHAAVVTPARGVVAATGHRERRERGHEGGGCGQSP
jgi:hypothetical protein